MWWSILNMILKAIFTSVRNETFLLTYCNSNIVKLLVANEELWKNNCLMKICIIGSTSTINKRRANYWEKINSIKTTTAPNKRCTKGTKCIKKWAKISDTKLIFHITSLLIKISFWCPQKLLCHLNNVTKIYYISSLSCSIFLCPLY